VATFSARTIRMQCSFRRIKIIIATIASTQ
jgi:hypothetical protein